MKISRLLAVLPFVALMIFVQAATARRQPAPGGKLVASGTGAQLEMMRRRNTQEPMVTRAQGGQFEKIIAPSLKGAPDWHSYVFSEVRGDDNQKRWTLSLSNQQLLPDALLSLRDCLANTGRAGRWPAFALAAAKRKVEVSQQETQIRVQFDRPVGAMINLLEGCSLLREDKRATGPFAAIDRERLVAHNGSLDRRPLLDLVELRSGAEHADIEPGDPNAPSTSILVAPYPDVILIVQTEESRTQDSFGIQEPEGKAVFREGLDADLLLAVYWAGRGRPVDGILPPGIAPARPMPVRVKAAPPVLTLAPLAPDAPRLFLALRNDDDLIRGVVDRLAVLLRGRGYGTQIAPTAAQELQEGAELLRWRAPTEDAALALLSLVGTRQHLQRQTEADLLSDDALFSANPDERLRAALKLERYWLDNHIVLPLLTAERWWIIHPDLRGVEIDASGTPILENAYLGGVYLGRTQ